MMSNRHRRRNLSLFKVLPPDGNMLRILRPTTGKSSATVLEVDQFHRIIEPHRSANVRTLIAVLIAVVCTTSMAQQAERPRAVTMKPKDVKKAWDDLEERNRWLLEVQDLYWNDEWFLDAVDRYAKTGVKPKLKLPKGVLVQFAEHSDRERLVRHCIGVPGFHKQVYVTKGRRGFVGGSMWLDDEVVPWKDIDIKGRHKPEDGRRMDSR